MRVTGGTALELDMIVLVIRITVPKYRVVVLTLDNYNIQITIMTEIVYNCTQTNYETSGCASNYDQD